MSTVLFQAALEFMPVHDILQWIEMNRISCAVTITLETEREVVLYLEAGKIIFANSRGKGASLSELVVKSGALNESQVIHALSESRTAGISLVRHLAENDLLSLTELTGLVKQQVEVILLEVFPCKAGKVVVTAEVPAALLNGPLHLDTGRALLDAVRVYDERTRDSTKQRNQAIETLNRRLYDEEFQLPVLPSILMQLISLMENESTTFQDMAHLIMTDQVLISRILKIANSPLYGGSGQVDSIHFAIVRLGMREIMNIVTGIKLNSMHYGEIPKEKLQDLLDDALKTAFVATSLARQCRLDPDEAFLGGLLLDLGKTVILSLAQDVAIEQELLDDLLDSRHAELGALIAKKWNYPATIQNLIRYHHTKNLGETVNKIHAVIQAADQVVCSAGVLDSELLRVLQLQPEDVVDIYGVALESFSKIKSL